MDYLRTNAARGLDQAEKEAEEVPAAFFADTDRAHAAGLEFGAEGAVVEVNHAHFMAFALQPFGQKYELTLRTALAKVTNEKSKVHALSFRRMTMRHNAQVAQAQRQCTITVESAMPATPS